MQRCVGPALILSFLASLTALACSGSSHHGSGDDGDGSGVSGDVIEFYGALFDAECEFLERCAGENGRAYVNTAACREELDLTLATLKYSAERLEGGFPYDVHSAYQRACIDSLYPKDSCNSPAPSSIPAACKQAITIRNAAGEGEACSRRTNALPCDWGLDCVEVSGCGHCEKTPANQPNGTACNGDDECASGHCGSESSCVVGGERGAPCSNSLDCAGALGCIEDAAGVSACEERHAKGSFCTLKSDCQGGLACVGSTCIDAGRAGDSCDRNGQKPCMALCNFATPDAPSGTCGVALPGEGDPCALSAQFPVCTDTRTDTTVDADGTITACVCSPPGPVGSSCRYAEDCESKACTPSAVSPADPGTCRTPYNDGERCYSNDPCASGYCNDENMCAPAPVCG